MSDTSDGGIPQPGDPIVVQLGGPARTATMLLHKKSTQDRALAYRLLCDRSLVAAVDEAARIMREMDRQPEAIALEDLANVFRPWPEDELEKLRKLGIAAIETAENVELCDGDRDEWCFVHDPPGRITVSVPYDRRCAPTRLTRDQEAELKRRLDELNASPTAP